MGTNCTVHQPQLPDSEHAPARSEVPPPSPQRKPKSSSPSTPWPNQRSASWLPNSQSFRVQDRYLTRFRFVAIPITTRARRYICLDIFPEVHFVHASCIVKAHKNGIKKPKAGRTTSMRGVRLHQHLSLFHDADQYSSFRLTLRYIQQLDREDTGEF